LSRQERRCTEKSAMAIRACLYSESGTSDKAAIAASAAS